MRGLIRRIALSDSPAAVRLRKARRSVLNFTLPAPASVVRPLLALFVGVREVYYFAMRVFVCEPLFKAYCTAYGKGVRTGVFIHWVQGSGRLIVGDNVLADGKCSISFATRYTENPAMIVGDNTILSHGCTFTIGRRITIGKDCMIAVNVLMFDSPGHPLDPVLRKSGAPANPEDVRPIEVGDNVWIGMRSVIFPGVRIGEGSVVAVGSQVMHDVPPYTVVAGNPARVVAKLKDANASVPEPEPKPAPASTTTEAALVEEVTAILRATLQSDDLDADEDFYDAGMTSIMVLPLMVELEGRFGLPPANDDLLEARTARELATSIEAILQSRTSPARSAPAMKAAVVSGSLDGVMQVLRQTLMNDDLGPDDDFYDAGMTSIMVLPLIVELEGHFGLAPTGDELLDARTGRELAERIDAFSRP